MNLLDTDTLRAAADSIARRPRAEMRDASRVVGEVLLAQAEARTGAVSHQQIEARCGEVGATDATGEVDGVRPIEVLRRGPKSALERAVVSVLLARHVGEILDGESGPTRLRARLSDLDWLEFTGPYAPYAAARVALNADTSERFEALLTESDVAAGSLRAIEAVRALRGIALDDEERSSQRSAGVESAVSVAVELDGYARGFVARLLSSLVGWGALRGLVRTVGGWIFSFRRPATLSLEGESLRLVGHSEVLGRTLRTWDIRMPVRELVELKKEVRYPSAPAALSIAGLLVGTLLGAKRVFEGVGARWFAVIAIGVGMILAGVATELVLRALWPGVTGRTRLAIRSKDSRALELTHVDSDEADRMLDAIDALLRGQRTEPARPARKTQDSAKSSGKNALKSWDVALDGDRGNADNDRTVEDPVKLDEMGGAPTLIAGTEVAKDKGKGKSKSAK
ncbi:MAG: hypothetical protein U0269_30930 [Polyangiales bacterium]